MVVSFVSSQQEGFGFRPRLTRHLSVRSLHVLPVPAWVLSSCSGFLPQAKDMQLRVIVLEPPGCNSMSTVIPATALNAEYGCPVQLARSLQAAHLQVCPASVVCCSMEWNRWPTDDAHSHPSTELHKNLVKEKEHGGCLDLAIALKDQDHLFHSMKMRKLFPELIQTKARAHIWEPSFLYNIHIPDEQEDEDVDEDEAEVEVEHERELTQEERNALARAPVMNADSLENYNVWERMFSMEMGGCREAAGTAVAGSGQRAAKGRGKSLGTLTEREDTADSCMGETASSTCTQVSSACNGPSTSSSCLTGKQKKMDFFYGQMEPRKINTVRTYKTPTSFTAKQGRIRNPGFYKRKSQAVDTSDLGVSPEEMPVWEEVQASLLCSLENEQRGHLIAERLCTDSLLQDEGTQTYNFLSAPFRRNTSLADLTAAKPLELHLQLQVESVTSRHHKASSAFTFFCGHTFQRLEYGKHYKNVHSDIQMCVNGWFEQRCPLAYLGCTYSQKRFQPSTHEATVNFKSSVGSSSDQRKRGGQAGGGEDSLSSLPYEVLCHMASFLDSLSLSQLALVSRLMRQVCSSLLQERGMVTLHWERKTYSHGGAKWRVKQKVWHFSTLFSPVDTWCFSNTASISEHLKVCPYYDRESRMERIHLPYFRDKIQTDTSCKGPTLVRLFQQKKITI
uniref:F-box domain-containing protein n=1 Tax=Monopterus albus TaxID=43700 RepID=A0A3Q3JZA7_MONAL